MKRKELAETFKVISNWKKPFGILFYIKIYIYKHIHIQLRVSPKVRIPSLLTS